MDQRRGFVVGFRYWHATVVDGSVALWPRVEPAASWRREGLNTATCHYGGDLGGEGWEWHGLVPSRGCDCGLHAFYRHETAVLNAGRFEWSGKLTVTGAVIGWGRVIPHEEGWRAQYARIVAIADGPNCELSRKAAEAYGVPTIHPAILMAFALEYGEEIPEHRRGMSEQERLQRHHDVERRLFADDELRRMGQQNVRLLALGIARACCDGVGTWNAVLALLGRDMDWLRRTIHDDIPRYQIPYAAVCTARCAVPMVRREGLCGKHSSHAVMENNPDGTITEHHFCTQHRAHAAALRRDIESRPRIEVRSPWNIGGALARYFATDWLRTYRWAAYEGNAWTPPPGCTLPQHPERSQIRVLAEPISLGTPYPAPPDAPVQLTVRLGDGQ